MLERHQIKAKRERGARQTHDPFLLHRCADNAAERLLDINRNFDNALIFGAPAFCSRLAAAAGGQKLKTVTTADISSAPSGVDILAHEAALPFADNSFDVVISGLTLHLQSDPRAALAQFKRVLKPDGVLIACLFGGATLSELRRVFMTIENKMLGRVSPRVMPMIELWTAGSFLQSVGLSMPVADRERITVNYKKFESLAHDLRRMGETNTLASRDKTPLTRSFFEALEEEYRSQYPGGGDTLRATFEIIWLSGWTPHSSQPKPLKPGAAKTRLADALGVTETKL